MKPICKLILVCLLCGTQSFAQKLPDIQKGSLRAPANVKVDGNLEEWTSLSAYNKRINVYYSIANDDENLYLIIKSDNSSITSKIFKGGIKFTVNASGASEKNAVSVTYPFVEDKQTMEMMAIMPKTVPVYHVMSAAEKKEEDMRREKEGAVFNRKVPSLFKFIKLTGIKGITDEQLPIYNDSGIKVGIVNEPKVCYYELALPLKFLNLSPGNASVIHYNIKLLGMHIPAGVTIKGSTNPDGTPKNQTIIRGGVDARSTMADADFWGEYVLAK